VSTFLRPRFFLRKYLASESHELVRPFVKCVRHRFTLKIQFCVGGVEENMDVVGEIYLVNKRFKLNRFKYYALCIMCLYLQIICTYIIDTFTGNF